MAKPYHDGTSFSGTGEDGELSVCNYSLFGEQVAKRSCLLSCSMKENDMEKVTGKGAAPKLAHAGIGRAALLAR